MSVILLDVAVVSKVYQGCLPKPSRVSVWSLRRDQAALTCPADPSLLWEPSSPRGTRSRAVAGAGHRARCVPRLLGALCLYHFICLGLAVVFPCSSFPLNKTNWLVVCVHREDPVTQSPSWVSEE